MSISMNNPNRNADVIKDPASTGTRDSIFDCSRAKSREDRQQGESLAGSLVQGMSWLQQIFGE
jgi:hypothetical protein